ncbi:MAG TPA: antibiotic biosynthesis monooxygenase [Actinomycetota bacterium]|nr:antibiotic biosynthesis monooxygenase [Actinomycetota bacterium]
MYGTIMRARVKADAREAFERTMAEWEERRGSPDGYHSSEIAWEEADPNRVVLVVHFRDKESYVANAQSPDQDAEYQEMVKLLEGPPEWIDVNYGSYSGKPLP